jgi:hypothetical protein
MKSFPLKKKIEHKKAVSAERYMRSNQRANQTIQKNISLKNARPEEKHKLDWY